MGKRRRRRGVDADSVQPDLLRIVVAASPGGEISVRREVELAKSALLYGDKVVLLSPATTMVATVEATADLSLDEQLRLIRLVAPYLMDGPDLTRLESTLSQVEQSLDRNRRSPGFNVVRSQLAASLKPHFAPITETINGVLMEAGVGELALARQRKLIEIDRTDPRDTVQFLASSVISAKLAESGNKRKNPQTNQIISSFVEKLYRHLESGTDYLVFDEAIASLVEAAVREGAFQPAAGPRRRSAQAMSAATFMARLPTFPDAKVDELLDIRDELEAPVTRFRSAMVTIARSLTFESWESDFGDQLHDAWIETVQPAILDIEQAVQQNRSLLTRAAGVTGGLNTSYPGLSIVAAGVLGHVSEAAIAGGVVSVAAPILKALSSQRASNEEIRNRPFYFLYGLKHSL